MIESSRPDATVHRPPRFHWWITTGSLCVILGLTTLSFVVDSALWQRVAMSGLSIVGIAGLLNLAWTRVELGPNALTVVSHFRRRAIARSEIDSVTWGKGVGVSVKLTDGRWVGLPEVGPGSQELTNSVRVWLDRASHPPSPPERRST